MNRHKAVRRRPSRRQASEDPVPKTGLELPSRCVRSAAGISCGRAYQCTRPHPHRYRIPTPLSFEQQIVNSLFKAPMSSAATIVLTLKGALATSRAHELRPVGAERKVYESLDPSG